ncbi:hypothetical protein P3342_000782 [Pyrenophora teres f. teres]|uniref:BTB domain-containing protein n=2 Tax=Pyrenophora teres f. teres TaxID=97479 RepID=E3RJM1_PYRTT|nr:hypothetical protein PTT_08357 [Pyrenophora teres f. teres 0-1]KAE8836098.1 hypothetical protein HRS9139_04196 [Pyrenophora teres f. teres]CAA9957051.1 btb poz domain-containing protein [Pyrenophora teres f. maculata]KAE8837929.1 hypothetical protein PTNB85_05264 [Pyrenophora teres f. teres]KAE8839650.1 hypothetical protein HRS9122_06255 [Pyrenophora teres f. teres]
MDAPMIELRSALASLFEQGQYSDLTIVCGTKRYQVHRVLLATRSTFFQGACRSGFREAETGVIDLSEDDAEAVEHMMHYFYHMDYLTKKPLSRRSSQRSNRPASLRASHLATRRNTPKKLNLTAVEDPLMALVAAANNAMPMTPPPEQNMFQNMDASTKMPDSPMVDDFFQDDDIESIHSEQEFDIETTHLVTHAKVYAIAEKYGIAGLKALARSKFADQIELHLNSAEFPEACQEAYESTFHTDRGLRDIIVQTFRANPSLSLRPDVEMAVRETPGLAFELFRMASGLPVFS